MNVMDEIRRRCELSGITQAELAMRCGMSRQEINRYFQGRILPSSDKIDLMLGVLNAAGIRWRK